MFILHTPKSSKPTTILIKITLSDGLFKRSLGISILPAFWDKEQERAIITNLDRSTADENKSINTLLQKVHTFIEGRQRDARYSEKHLKCEELEAKVSEITGKKKRVEESVDTTFYPLCRMIIADMKSGLLLTPQGKRYSKGTIKNYNQSLNTIEEYNPDQTFDGISMDWYRSFIKWCNDKDFSMNYIAQHIKNLIRLMRVSKSRGWHNNTEFLKEEFRVIQENTDDITLYQYELDNISDIKLENNRWDIARDWFVIGSQLGLRVSDVSLLDENINFNNDFCTIANEKTDTKVVIPINSRIKLILKKWGGLPPKMHDVYINEYIKEVAKLCKIDSVVLYFLTKGGQRKDFYLKKYEMVSCHTMRRFFISELLRMNVPDNQVMQLAGIKKHATLLRYKKIKPEETAMDMKKNAFFK